MQKLRIIPSYIRLSSSEIFPLYAKPARSGSLPLLATLLVCFESAQQIERLRREWQGGLPLSAMLSLCLEFSRQFERPRRERQGGSHGGKHALPAAKGSVLQSAAVWVYAPASLPSKHRVDVQTKVEQGNNMHHIKSTAELYYINCCHGSN